MIQINKSALIPIHLSTLGVPDRLRLCTEYDANPVSYHNGHIPKPVKLKINQDIYGDTAVKAQLKLDQNNKCCYCENKDFDDIAFGDIEHFRPKGGFRQSSNQKLQKPGYF